MQRAKVKTISGWILLSAAVLQFVLLLSSMVASFFLPADSGMWPQWSSYLIALVLLGIVVVGIRQIWARHETAPLSLSIDVPLGLILGIVAGVVLMIRGLGLLLGWASFGLPMLVGILLQGPNAIYSISWFFALTAVALYGAFIIIYNTCYNQVIRSGGTIKAGIWSCMLAIMATFLGASLTFSLSETIAYLGFHVGNDMIGASSIPGFSQLMNALASYQGAVALIALWLLTPVLLSLLVVLIRSLIRRRTASRLALA